MRGNVAAHVVGMTLTPTYDPLLHLEAEFDLELHEQVSVTPREPELWWEGWETQPRLPVWSVAFAMDLFACIDEPSGFPFVVIGDARGPRWMQAWGSAAGLMVELGGAAADSNAMGVMGRPGGGRSYVSLIGTEHNVELREHQVLLVADAQAIFSAYILGGVFPEGYELEFVTY
ncbi:hypothetical protein [Cryobacterium sp. CG_9.6]|uniref:hypothetical protein n=1 Tax=Cryobacterium sp. CG_9.6 TaxID=2760710 RepID=UPI002476697C|nr:hypothetical protein [Cryobacterium sp. CG_9.6]